MSLSDCLKNPKFLYLKILYTDAKIPLGENGNDTGASPPLQL